MENQIIEFVGNHLLLAIVWLVSGSLLLANILRGGAPGVGSQQLVNMVNRHNGVVVDIRSHAEFEKGHITAALNIPAGKLVERIAELENHKDAPIIVVCNAGVQAGAAAQQVKKAGFEQVFKLSGGMQSWRTDNLPVTKA